MNETPIKKAQPDRRLFVHAGTHKTGTSAFQKVLEQGADGLRKSGIHILTPSLIGPGQSGSDSLLARCAKDKGRSLVLSHETICTFPVERLSKLLSSVSPGYATYVVVFRYWPNWLFSRWAQSSLRRDAQSVHTYLAKVMANPFCLQDVAYHQIIQRARTAGFEDIRVISFDNARDSLMKILMDQCGIPGIFESRGIRKNQTSDRLNDDLVRLFNGVRSETENRNQNALFEKLSFQTPIDCFYDQSFLVERALHLDPDLGRDLSAMVAETQREVRLEPFEFRQLDVRLENEVGETAVNRISGQFFADKKSKSVMASDIEVNDLDTNLKNRMWRSLSAARQLKPPGCR